MKFDSVSAIIPFYNGAEFIGDAIRSVLAQTRPPEEIIVVDDGSEEAAEGVLEEFQDKLIFLRQDHQGASAARNRAISRATGEWLAFLDQDDEWFPQKLEKQLAAVAGREEIALAYSDMEIFGEETAPSRLQGLNTPSGWVFKDLLFANFITPSAAIAHRQAVIDVGGFDEQLEVVHDRDLCLRLAARWQMLFVPGIFARYRKHQGNLSHKRLQAQINLYTILRHRAKLYAPEEYCAALPRLKPMLGELSFEVGRLYLAGGEAAAARKWFAKSLRYRGRRLRSTAYFGISLLPRPARETLRQVKRIATGSAD